MKVIETRAVGDPLVEALYELIRTGELSPGQRVDQREVSERLQVSRTPLREALRALASDGVLVRTPNSGYDVAKLSASDLLQYYSMRSFLETEVLKTMVWPDELQLDELKDINETCRRMAAAGDIDRLVEANQQFHFLTFTWSPLTIMFQEIQRVWRVSAPYRALHLSNPERRKRVPMDHDKIVMAIEKQDRSRLIKLMDEHRGHSLSLLIEMLGPSVPLALLSLPQTGVKPR